MLICQMVIAGACVISSGLDYVTIQEGKTYADSALSYDGVARDIRSFYTNEDLEVSVGGHVVLLSGTKVSLGYSNGVDAEKYDVSDSYTIGVDQIVPINNRSWFTLSASTTFGGDESHTPCRDSYNREYYCGNLTAWSDFKQEKKDQDYNVGIRYTRRF